MAPKKGSKHHRRYPFRHMKIGESFFVPHTDAASSTIQWAACQQGKRLGKRFKTKTQGDGTRVWRVDGLTHDQLVALGCLKTTGKREFYRVTRSPLKEVQS